MKFFKKVINISVYANLTYIFDIGFIATGIKNTGDLLSKPFLATVGTIIFLPSQKKDRLIRLLDGSLNIKDQKIGNKHIVLLNGQNTVFML